MSSYSIMTRAAARAIAEQEATAAANDQVQTPKPLVEEVKKEPTHTTTSRTYKSRSSSATMIRRRQLEFEAAEAEAAIETEMAERRKELIKKKLAMELAQLEECSQKDDEESLPASSCDRDHKVTHWLSNSLQNENVVRKDLEQEERRSLPSVAEPLPRPLEMPIATQPSQPYNIVEKLAEAIQTAVVASSSQVNNEILTRLATSKDLPVYYGDPMEWLQFKQAYGESTQLCKYSDTENLWRLRKCLRGEAKDCVSSLLIGGSSPANVIETLELRFGRAENIMSKILIQLKKLPPLSPNYHNEIVNFAIKVQNYVAAAKAIKQYDYLRSPELVNIIVSKLPTALITRWTDFLYERRDSESSKLELLSDFLHHEASKSAAAGVSCVYSQAEKRRYEERKPQRAVVLYTADDNCNKKCKFCRGTYHALDRCKRFKSALKRDRWRYVRINRLCYKCLGSRHDESILCPAADCEVDECGQPHHRLLHWVKSKEKVETDRDDENQVETAAVNHLAYFQNHRDRVALKIVPVTVHGPRGAVNTHALLDDGATVTLVAAELADAAGLHGDEVTMRAKSAWDSGELICVTQKVNFELSNASGKRFSLTARKIRELNLPMQYTYVTDFKKIPSGFNNYFFKDLNCRVVQPKILIGQDNYNLILPIQCIPIEKYRSYLTRTSLGWCLHGRFSTINGTGRLIPGCSEEGSINHCVLVNSEANVEVNLSVPETECKCVEREPADLILHEEIRRSFAIDAIGILRQPRQNLDEQRAVSILEETSTLIDGRWTVGLPWKQDDVVMPESFCHARKRLLGVERKMKANEEYAARYKGRVDHLFTNGFARELSVGEEDSGRVWYLPHFGVDNPNKRKLRLVFDAAAKSNGLCLNDFLLQGPDMLQSLLGIMMRFRENPVGLMGDIVDMFLRIQIRQEDQHALRFLWRDDNQELKTYLMTSLIFGANCSPFVAQYVNQTLNPRRFEQSMPEAVAAIRHSQYMDDFIDSFPDADTAIKMARDIAEINQQGGFNMHNWTSNNAIVLSAIEKEIVKDETVKLSLDSQAERTLGLLRYPGTDSFGFNVSLSRIPVELLNLEKKPTKRQLLSIVMSIFDVHGFLAPFTVKARLLIQECWRQNIDWDQEVSADLFILFGEWVRHLHTIKEIRIPRWYFRSELQVQSGHTKPSLELHVFCDASPAVYVAVAYWRKLCPDGRLLVTMIASPSSPSEASHDSQARASKLAEIDSLSTVDQWNYVPTKLNIADVATKRMDYELRSDCDWFRGPEFLYSERNHWPREPKIKEEVSDDKLEQIYVIQRSECHLPVPDAERFSSWLRLLYSTVYVLVFVNRCLKRPHGFDVSLLQQAEEMIIRQAQYDSFAEEIELLKINKPLNKNSRLLILTPVIDERGLLRVGGRIDAAENVDASVKRPVIIDGKHVVTRLIVQHYHRMMAHGYNELVVNELRQRYWVLNLRPTVRNVASKCLFCRIRKAIPQVPRMRDLPGTRLLHHERPFTSCGVDLFGPVEEVTVGRRREHRYGVLFTCLVVRAVHIEIVPSLSTDSLIMALRRMAARRGWPRIIVSDNGTNLRGADAELRKSIKSIPVEVLKSAALVKGVDWKFISPASPHMGGAWERLIRSVKSSLKVILKERAPCDEVLSTLLAEVENIINSRPLSHVSVDHRSDEALTPNHFFLGSSSNLPVQGSFDDSDLYLRRRWRVAQRLTDLFWSRWLREFLPVLVSRQKWHAEGPQIKKGDLVILVDPGFPRNVWPRGMIDEVHPGKDGRVRIVDVRLSNGKLMRRPVTKIIRLPTV